MPWILPPAPRIGSIITAASSFAFAANEFGGALDVVVVRKHEFERNVKFATAAEKLYHSAMVGIIEGKQFVATGYDARCGQCHEIGFSACIAEPDLLKRREALAQQSREFSFVRGWRAHGDTA